MSAYNIVRKRKVLETNLNSEEITNFYPIFYIYFIFITFIVISFRTSVFSFRESYFRLVGLFDWGYAERNFFFRYPGIGTFLHWRDTEMKNLLPTLPNWESTQFLCMYLTE